MSDEAPADLVLWAKDLSKTFGAQTALQGLSLSLPQGKFLSILGPNGAGKTTLLNILAGLTFPSGGEVRVLGSPPRRHCARLKARVGFISHQPQLYSDLSADENLRFFAALYGVPDAPARIDEVLTWVELEHRRADPVRSLSQGMKQRLTIARALLPDPDVLLLDEPTTGLDERAIGVLTDLLSTLHDGKRTLLMTTHRIELGIEVADQIGVMVGGRIVHESEAASLTSVALRDLYGSLAGGAL
jgi:heme exporter protein A